MQPTTPETSRFSRFTNGIMARWNSKSHSGSIFRNMAMLASGSAGAKAIGVLSVPVITRIYLPEHFGVLAVESEACIGYLHESRLTPVN